MILNLKIRHYFAQLQGGNKDIIAIGIIVLIFKLSFAEFYLSGILTRPNYTIPPVMTISVDRKTYACAIDSGLIISIGSSELSDVIKS